MEHLFYCHLRYNTLWYNQILLFNKDNSILTKEKLIGISKNYHVTPNKSYLPTCECGSNLHRIVIECNNKVFQSQGFPIIP